MSVKKELEKVTGVQRGEDESHNDYAKRLVRKVAALSDKEWDALSKDAQAWYNGAASAMNSKSDIPPLDDEEEAPPARRNTRASVKDEEPAEPAEPKVGDTVTVKTSGGDTYKGELIEAGERTIVVVVDGEEEIIKRKDIKSILVASAPSKSKDKDDEPPAREPKVGDHVVVTMSDGEKVTGELLEAGERTIVVAVGKDEEVLKRKDIKSMAVAPAPSKGKDKDEEEAPPARGRGKGKDDDEKGSSKGKDKEAGPKPATVRIREIMCETPSITKEAVGKQLDKEGVEVKGTTLDITFSEVSRTLNLLRQFGNLKD